MGAGDFVGMGDGDFLDAGAADAGEDHQWRLRAVIHDDAGVELAGDVELLFDEHFRHGEVLDPLTEQRFGDEGGFVRGRRFADSAEARTSGHPHLRLDHHRAPDLGGDSAGCVWGRRRRATRCEDALLCQLLFSLILMQSGHSCSPENT